MVASTTVFAFGEVFYNINMNTELHSSGKTPSFPFYPKDWLSDLKVQSLSMKEQGIYLKLLCYSWLDELPANIKIITKLLHSDRTAIEKILKMFFLEENGNFFNKKLEKIKQELILFRQKKSEAGKKGNAVRWGEQNKKEVSKQKIKSSQCDTFASRKSSPPFPSPFPSSNNKRKIYKKKSFLDFILLTQDEEKKLKKKFGEKEFNVLIEKLNNYIGSTGKKYKSHYFTILNWANKDLKNERYNDPEIAYHEKVKRDNEKRKKIREELQKLIK